MAKITLKAARINAGLTLKDVEEATGINASMVSRYETSKIKISVQTASMLCKLYSVALDDINFLPTKTK